MNELDDEKLITKLKFRFGDKFPFLAGLCNSIKLELTDEPIVMPDGRTTHAVVSGLNIKLDKGFVKKDFDTAIGVFAHEVLHVALMHNVRYTELVGKGLDRPYAWGYNILADLRINELLRGESLNLDKIGAVNTGNVVECLEQAGFVKKKGCSDMHAELCNEIVKDSEMDTDRAFSIFKDVYEFKGDGDGSGLGSVGNGFDGSDLVSDGSKPSKLKSQIEEAMIGSLIGGQGRGSGSSNLERTFKAMYYDTTPDWAKIIKQGIMRDMRREVNYNAPSKKSIELDFEPNLPAYRNSPYKYLVAVAIDSSGSMDTDKINKIVGEIMKITKNYHVRFDVMVCDDGITNYVKGIDSMDKFSKLKLYGGGGTSFRPVFDKIAELRRKKGREKEVYKCLVYFTDGIGDNGTLKKVKGLRTYWCVDNTEDVEFPFGEVLKLR